jgi:hypothetical protein
MCVLVSCLYLPLCFSIGFYLRLVIYLVSCCHVIQHYFILILYVKSHTKSLSLTLSSSSFSMGLYLRLVIYFSIGQYIRVMGQHFDFFLVLSLCQKDKRREDQDKTRHSFYIQNQYQIILNDNMIL